MQRVNLAVFSDGSGHGTASAHLVDSNGVVCGQTALRYDDRRITAGALELCGIVLGLDMVMRFTETLGAGQVLSVTFYCDNMPMVDYSRALRAGDGTLPRDEHLNQIHGLLRARIDRLCAAGHMWEIWSPRRLRSANRIRYADLQARLAAQGRNDDIQAIPDDLLAALTHCTDVLRDARRFRWADYATMVRL